MSAREPLTLEQCKALSLHMGEAKPATLETLISLAESVRDHREHEHPTREDWFCLNLVGFMGERMGAVLRRLLDAEEENARLRAERDEARARVAELEQQTTTTRAATPSEIDAFLHRHFTEDTLLRYQQTIGEQIVAEAVEDAQVVRAQADNEGLYNADWREGWDDAMDRIDPDRGNGPYPAQLMSAETAEAGGSR